MTEQIRQKLSDSAAMRWTALVIVAFTMMMGYFLTDVMSPLENMLETQLHWTSSEYGFFSGSYGYINVFLLMLIFRGIILDKMGIRFTGIMAAGLMMIGGAIKYAALQAPFDANAYIFGMHSQVIFTSLGFAVFGVGCEITGITVSKVIVKWFTGYELALAMGFQVALARLGTAAAMGFSLPIAKHFGNNVSYPVMFGAIALCISILAYLVYCVMDKKFDTSKSSQQVGEEDGFVIKDLKYIFTNKGFW